MIRELQDKYTILTMRRTKVNNILSWVVPITIGFVVGQLISTWYWSVLIAIVVAIVTTPIVLSIVDTYYHRRLMSITKQISDEVTADEPQHVKDACMDSVVND